VGDIDVAPGAVVEIDGLGAGRVGFDEFPVKVEVAVEAGGFRGAAAQSQRQQSQRYGQDFRHTEHGFDPL
jgi:hypothetical protein